MDDEAYIAELIVRLAINNEDHINDDWRLIPSYPDDDSIRYTTQDLMGTVAYFKKYNPDDVLRYFFDDYKDGPNDSLLVFSEAQK